MSKNQSRNLKRMQKKAKDRDDLDFCKENRDNIEYIRSNKDLLKFCKEHRDKIDQLIFITSITDALPLQQRLHAQAVERDLNQLRMDMLQGRIKAIFVEPVDPVLPLKKSKPIPIPGAKIEEIDGYETDTEESAYAPDDVVEGALCYKGKEKQATIEELD